MAHLNELAHLAPENILFWTGAGISADFPTGGPLGMDLTYRALDGFFLPGLRDDLKNLYSSLNISHVSSRPRLETVLDALAVAYGLPALEDVLSDLINVQPNDVHGFFAAHCDKGGSHITANFDTCIERSSPTGSNVVHFHGALSGRTGVDALGARLSVIENGFSEDLVRLLDELLERPSLAAVIFAGYSGSDFFDASPYLNSRWHLLKGKRVVWHNYGPSVASRSGADCDSIHPLLRSAREAGAEVRYVQEPLRDSLSDLAVAWGMSRLRSAPQATKPKWTSSLARTDDERTAATITLLSKMGVRDRVIDLIEAQGGPRSPSQADGLADALWGAGRYRDAARAWARAIDQSTEDGRARFAERRGAVFWIRGQYIRSERLLRRALDRWASPGSGASPRTRAKLAETYGRVLTHMRRSPDTRMLASRRRVQRAGTAVAEATLELHGAEGLDLRARLFSALADLNASPDLRSSRHVAEFDESDGLNGWLSFRHQQIRQRAQAGFMPSVDELASLRKDQLAIGACGDAARVVLLPGAGAAYPWHAGWTFFKGVDITWWQRIRFGVLFLVKMRGSRGNSGLPGAH